MKVLVDYVRTSIEVLLQMKLEKHQIKQIAEGGGALGRGRDNVPKPKHL
jgi:hypothetical protein